MGLPCRRLHGGVARRGRRAELRDRGVSLRLFATGEIRRAMAELAHRAGIPAGVFNVVPSSDSPGIGRAFSPNPRVRKITFIGSIRVREILMQQSARDIKKPGLEPGGNVPFLVFDDADLDAAVEGARARNPASTIFSS